MIVNERELRIKEMLETSDFVKVIDLMKIFNVSRSSINRDLKNLENNGFLNRTRGGAYKKNLILSSYYEDDTNTKMVKNVTEKRKICKVAATMISDGDCVYIDSGSTSIYLAEFLVNKTIDIVTPSFSFIKSMDKSFGGNIYILGGHYNYKYDMSLGSITLENLNKFNFNIAILTANGINFESKKVYSLDTEVASIKAKALEQSNQSILLVDSSKFSLKGKSVFADIDSFNSIILDKDPNLSNEQDNIVIA